MAEELPVSETRMKPEALPMRPRDAQSAAWWDSLELIGEDAGYYEPLGNRHAAFFSDQGPVLLVTFETSEQIRTGAPDQLPLAFRLTQSRGWSSLTIVADGPTWWRDPAVFAYFDRLVDDAFFEDFERVVFFGIGAGGYAAAAFSVTAPGATVIAIQPQATLDPRIAGWDTRYPEMRRTSFSDRYGFAPDMIEGAGEGFVIYDPMQMLDAMHAALFTKAFITKLPCAYLGANIGKLLMEMNILPEMLIRACEGRFSALAFWQLYRQRRASPRYLRGLSAVLDAENRPLLNALLCRNAVRRFNGPRFRSRLTQLEDELLAEGVNLPPARAMVADPVMELRG